MPGSISTRWDGASISDASESGLVAMNMIASHAYQLGTTSSLYEGDDGRIAQLYVW